ncbi:MAG: HEAT repeat domain-containing protein [Pseudomonadota bacterium]
MGRTMRIGAPFSGRGDRGRRGRRMALLRVVPLLVVLACGSTVRAQSRTDVAALVGQLNSDVESVRIDAGRRLTTLGAAAAPGLIAAFRHGNETARQFATVILGSIGAPAVPALIAALGDADVRVRLGAAEALAFSGTPPADAVPALARATHDASPKVRAAAIRALAGIGPQAAAAVPDLVAALADGSDEIRVGAANALGAIGAPARSAVPALRTALQDTSNEVKSGAAEALLGIDPANRDVIADVMRLFANEDANVRGLAAAAMAQSGTAALPLLIRGLGDSQAMVRAESAGALALIGKKSAPAAAALTRALADPGEEVRRNAADALREIGPAAAGATKALTIALDDRFAAVRANAASALGSIGPAALSALAPLTRHLDDSDSTVRQAAVTALAAISPASGPALLAALERHSEPIEASNIARALARIAASFQDASKQLSNRDLADAIALLQRFQARVLAKSPSTTDALDKLTLVLKSLDAERARRNANSQRVLAYAAAALIAAALALLLALLASFQFRRRALALIGRRWDLVTGQCDGVVEVFRGTALVRPLFASQSTATGIELSSWPPRDEDIAATRALFAKGGNLKVVVERSRFSQLWAHAIGDPWADGEDAIIAGQLCFAAPDSAVRAPPGQRNIAFAGVACASPPGMAPLSAPEAEIEAVARCHRRWGADVRPSAIDASIQDLRDSLTGADFVHVAAHASTAGVHLRDGFLGGDGLDADLLARLRCRLLVLSACDAGRLEQDDSFAYRLVECGVNIIAAINPVRDQICRTFFEEFYNALLPSRRVEGVQIGAAIREAATRCAARSLQLEQSGMKSQVTGRWKDSVNSFVLYGDPSAHLVLR